MQVIGAIRETILKAKSMDALKQATQIATILADQLGEIPEVTKRRWKLAEERALKRLQKDGESAAAKAKKGSQKPNTKQRRNK
jgi:hypothetical protein